MGHEGTRLGLTRGSAAITELVRGAGSWQIGPPRLFDGKRSGATLADGDVRDPRCSAKINSMHSRNRARSTSGGAVLNSPAEYRKNRRPGMRGNSVNPLLERITIDPRICGGKPCIRGTRIWVSLILDFLSEGMTEAELLDEYTGLTHEDVLAAIAYGAEAARERAIPVPAETAT
jgi:uncharacterized protein (DUF433 family)